LEITNTQENHCNDFNIEIEHPDKHKLTVD